MNIETTTIKELVERKSADRTVVERIKYNISEKATLPNREEFWQQLVIALLTSQQRSTEGSPVSRFAQENPFPLSLLAYKNLKDQQIETLIRSRSLRFGSRITGFLRDNYLYLFGPGDGWPKMESLLTSLVKQREVLPEVSQMILERNVARVLDEQLRGIGPKQSRNLLQELGLTRYEIPLDSRVAGWLNENLHWEVLIPKLGSAIYYEQVLNRVQAACEMANVLPTVFDAAAWVVGKSGSPSARPTTVPGYVNRRGQIVVRNTGLTGTDHLQTIYQLGCSHCGHIYGANGSDIHDRKCPECQGGAKGLEYIAG
jgi:hypothetical protein